MPMTRQDLGDVIVNELVYRLGSFPAKGFLTTISSDLNKQLATSGNPKSTLFNFVLQ